MLNMPIKCKTHPRYMAKRKPTSRCLGCWEYYIDTKREPDWQALRVQSGLDSKSIRDAGQFERDWINSAG